MQPMGGAPYIDSQFLYMQPGMMNPQFLGYDPAGQQQVMSSQGYPMSPIDVQQQFYSPQMPGFVGKHPLQIKVVFNQQQATPGGPEMVAKALLVTILDNNQDVIRKVTTASELGQSGQSQDAMNILLQLQKGSKISLQDLQGDEIQPQDVEKSGKDLKKADSK